MPLRQQVRGSFQCIQEWLTDWMFRTPPVTTDRGLCRNKVTAQGFFAQETKNKAPH